MRKFLCVAFVLNIFGLFFFSDTNIAEGVVTLPWSTTFDCPDWTSYSQTLDCDDLDKGGGWTCDSCTPSKYEEIISEANYSGGEGGKGVRHYLGSVGADNSGSVVIYFPSGVTEFWMRFYVRFESGWVWTGLQIYKLLYFYWQGGGNPCMGMPVWGDRIWLSQSVDPIVDVVCGWYDMYPTGTSDGSWHLYEVHLKASTGSNYDGVFQTWINGVLKVDEDALQYSDVGTGMDHIMIGSNGNVWSAEGCHAIDYDDIAISTTGYIGPLGGSGSTSISSPANLTGTLQ